MDRLRQLSHHKKKDQIGNDNQVQSVNLLHSPFSSCRLQNSESQGPWIKVLCSAIRPHEGKETPDMALQRILGGEMWNIEIKLNYIRSEFTAQTLRPWTKNHGPLICAWINNS